MSDDIDLEFIKNIDDVNSVWHVARTIAKGVKSTGPGSEMLGPIGIGLDAYSTAKGSYDIQEGINNGEDLQVVDGVHDYLDGATGLLGNLPGPVGMGFKAANAGLTVGDWIAPYYFNDAASEGSVMQEVPEDGEFEAHTGNASIDQTIDGVREISDGDYVEGAGDVAAGALDTVAPFVPMLAPLDLAVDGAQYLWGD